MTKNTQQTRSLWCWQWQTCGSLMLQKGTKQRKMFHCDVHKGKACAVYQLWPYGHSWCAPPEESDAHIKLEWRKRRGEGERCLPPTPPSAHFSRPFHHHKPQYTHIERVPPAPPLLSEEKEASVAHYLIVLSFPSSLNPLPLPSPPLPLYSLWPTELPAHF